MGVDVAEFTKGVLLWWASNGKDFPMWALAAYRRLVHARNSAALLKLMFGDLLR